MIYLFFLESTNLRVVWFIHLLVGSFKVSNMCLSFSLPIMFTQIIMILIEGLSFFIKASNTFCLGFYNSCTHNHPYLWMVLSFFRPKFYHILIGINLHPKINHWGSTILFGSNKCSTFQRVVIKHHYSTSFLSSYYRENNF